MVQNTERFGPGEVELTIAEPGQNHAYAWYETLTSTTALQFGPTFRTPPLTQSRSYFLEYSSCIPSWGRGEIRVILKKVRITVGGTVPTAPVPLAYSTNGTAPLSLLLQAETSPTSTGPFTWELNGVPLAAQGAQLLATQPGRYVVRLPGSGSAYDSQPVDVLEPFDGQTANGQPLTYFTEVQVLKPNVTEVAAVKQLAAADRNQTVTYANGFGQPIQRVALQAGPDQQDVVQHVGYAGNPTQTQTFLPFPQSAQAKGAGLYETDPVTKINAYYAAKGGLPYATTTAEASPLGRPVDQTQTGQAWAGHTSNVSYQANAAQEVRLWNGFDGTRWYPEGQLSKEIQLDPDNRRTEVFKDQFGRVVLQRKVTGTGAARETFDTYNVYDEFGHLQLVIPPGAVRALAVANQWNINSLPASTPSFKERWLYQYTYDERNRLIERQFPGAAPVYLVYDPFDRPILVQDGNHRTAGQWLFTKFDAQNRPVVEGLYTQGGSRQALQTQADAAAAPAEFETRAASGYTTTNTFPAVQDGTTGTVLSMTFYDDYDLDGNGQPDYAYRPESLGSTPQPVPTTQLRGLTTVTRRRVVQPNGRYGSWLTTALFYDEYGNLIQKQGNNLQQTGPDLADITTLVYRSGGFVPQVLRSIKTQQTGRPAPVVVRNRFVYDAAGRTLQAWQQHQYLGQWEPEVLVAGYRYSGLGELTQKQLHSRDQGAKFLQYEDFAYNLHGQLSSINNGSLKANTENDLFGFAVVREQTNGLQTGNTARYDGGIAAVIWMVHNGANPQTPPERERSYRFTYDGLGRLTAAAYAARVNPGEVWGLEQGAYDERTGYDANGNITAVQRYTQQTAGSPAELIDNLDLKYDLQGAGGNRLLSAFDNQRDNRGFKNSPTSPGGYAYDANGSITHDGNKGVDYAFNTLNKVEKQTVGTGSISYTYDAAGTVLKRETVSAARTQTEYYVDGFVYETSAGFAGLRSVPTPEGRALVVQAGDAKLTYEYHLRDHLGNLRVAFRAQAGTETLQLSSENPSQEEGPYPKFENVTVTRSTATTAYQGSYVAAVTNASGSPATPGHPAVAGGPAISVPVAHGDHLQVRVFCKTPAGVQYFRTAPPTTANVVPTVALAVAPALLPTQGGPQADGRSGPRAVLGIQLNLTGLLSALAAKSRAVPSVSRAQPGALASTLDTPLNAYLRWTLTNAQGQTVRSGQLPVPVFTDNGWHQLDLPLDIDLSAEEARTGTLRLQEVNEAANPVYFDLLTVTRPQDQALVSQENHYYPLGLPMSGVAVNTVPAEKISKQQFNGGSELQDELLGAEGGVYSTFYRTYDPATGRFTGVDPLSDAFTDLSPYQFGNNDPINFNDPSGALSQPIFMYGALMNPRGVNGEREWAGTDLDSFIYQQGGAGITYDGHEVMQINGVTGYYSITSTRTVNSDHGSVRNDTNVPGEIFYTATFTQISSPQTGFIEGNWKDLAFFVNDGIQAYANRNTALSIARGYRLARTTVFLPGKVGYISMSTKFLGGVSTIGKLAAKASPWVAIGAVGMNVIKQKQITAGDAYQIAVTGLSLIEGAGLIVGGTALAAEGASLYFTEHSVSENINSSLNGGVIWTF